MNRLIITLILMMLLVIPAYAGMDDRSDRLSNEQSSVFSPGYINATKQHTDEIINQQNPNKNFFERAMDYMKNKLSNKVAEDSMDKPMPELKKKKGGQEDNGHTGQAPEQLSGSDCKVLTAEGMDYDIANGLLNDAAAKGASVVKLSNGNIASVWKDASNSYRLDIKDDQGNLVAERLVAAAPSDGRQLYFKEISQLGDKFLIKYDLVTIGQQTDNFSNYHDVSYEIYNAQGNMEGQKTLRTTRAKGGGDWIYNDLSSITSLGNGTFAMAQSYYVMPGGGGAISNFTLNYKLVITDSSFNVVKQLQLYNGKGGLGYNTPSVVGIASLDNGNFAVGFSGAYINSIKVVDSNMRTLSEQNFNGYIYDRRDPDGTRHIGQQKITNIAALENGMFAVGWNYSENLTKNNIISFPTLGNEIKVLDYDEGLKKINQLSSTYIKSESVISGSAQDSFSSYLRQMKMLDDGSLVVAITNTHSYSDTVSKAKLYEETLDIKRFDVAEDGKIVSADTNIGCSLSPANAMDVDRRINGENVQIIALGGNNFGVIYQERDLKSGTSKTSVNQFTASGSSISLRDSAPMMQTQLASTLNNLINSYGQGPQNAFDRKAIDDYMFNTTDALSGMKAIGNTKAGNIASIFKGLLKDKDEIFTKDTDKIDRALIENIVDNILRESALSLPVGEIGGQRFQQMEVALILANILKNPNNEQKLILDSVEALLKETKDMDQSGSPELKKCEDDLLQMVAAILVAQAIPDLLKEGDVANIKSIFQELDSRKGKILLEYQESTKPYYNEMVRELSNNLIILQINSLLQRSFTKEELEKLSRSDMDKIVEKLKNASNKSQEMEKILKKEEELRSQYLDPNKKLLEEHMKDMMKGFTQRLSKVLEDKGQAKK